jgi:ribosomal protein L34E
MLFDCYTLYPGQTHLNFQIWGKNPPRCNRLCATPLHMGVDTQRPYGVFRYPQCGDTPQRPDFGHVVDVFLQNDDLGKARLTPTGADTNFH